MEQWQGMAPEVKEYYAVIHVVKRTAEKELVLLQSRKDGTQVLLRNYPGELSSVYALLAGKSLEHIPRILAAEQREAEYYVLEEFVEGKQFGGSVLSTQDALIVLRQLCTALSALHALGVVHRDIKPEHLLQDADGKLYLLDLDAARLYKSHVDKDTCTLGTTGFAAPEQFGIVQTDHRADIFALGVTLNVLLTGCHPSKQLCTGWLRHIVLKCTQIDPKARYQTAGAVWRSAALLHWISTWNRSGKAKRHLALGTCAALCMTCAFLLRQSLTAGTLPVADTGSILSINISESDNGGESGNVSGSEPASMSSTDSSSTGKSWLDNLFGLGHSADQSGSGSDKSGNSTVLPPANAGPGIDVGQSGSKAEDTASSSPSSSKPQTSSSKPASSSGTSSKPSTSGDSSSSKPSDSSSSKPTSSSSSKPPSSSESNEHEEEIRAAIAEYNAINSEYQRISALHQESYQRYQALHGYELSKLMTQRELAKQEAASARASAAEAQARADAYGSADPPDLEAQAQAQAEADSYLQLAEQKDAEVNTAAEAWSALYNSPDNKAAEKEFTQYAVQANALGPQVTAARDRINYLQNLYGIYLM